MALPLGLGEAKQLWTAAVSPAGGPQPADRKRPDLAMDSWAGPGEVAVRCGAGRRPGPPPVSVAGVRVALAVLAPTQARGSGAAGEAGLNRAPSQFRDGVGISPSRAVCRVSVARVTRQAMSRSGAAAEPPGPWSVAPRPDPGAAVVQGIQGSAPMVMVARTCAHEGRVAQRCADGRARESATQPRRGKGAGPKRAAVRSCWPSRTLLSRLLPRPAPPGRLMVGQGAEGPPGPPDLTLSLPFGTCSG